MTTFPTKIRENIVAVGRNIMFLSDAISQQNLGSMFLSHNALVISETALLALIASDQVADMEESESILIRDRVEVLLQEIAFKCFDLQESLHKADMQKHINDAVRFCKIILDLVGISPEEMQLPAKAPTPILALPAQAETIGQMLQILEQQEDKTEKLRREIQILRELLFSLLSEREHLTAVVVRDIEARYMQELGRLEADLYRTECEVRLLKRKVEIMQASLNRQEPIQEETIDETVQAQYQEFLNSYEELLRKIFEAAAYFERRQKPSRSKWLRSRPAHQSILRPHPRSRRQKRLRRKNTSSSACTG